MLETAAPSLINNHPRAVALGTTVEELKRMLQQWEVRHLPVVDKNHYVVGMISQRDVAQAIYNTNIKSPAGSIPSVAQKNVEHIMARQVMTLEHLELPEVALQAMVAHGFHAMPVTDEGRLVGIVSSTDFLRELSYGNWPGHDDPIRHQMSSQGHTVDADDPLGHALEVAEWHAQEFVVAVRRYRPLGILSRTALRLSLYGGGSTEEIEKLRATPVRMLLPPLPALQPEMSLRQAAGRMLEHGARALPVVERSRLLLGMLKEDDILHAMADRVGQ